MSLRGKVGLLVASILLAAVAAAQPSGGPFGPIDRVYAMPKAKHVFVVAPDGKPDAPGTLARPTSIEAAIAKAAGGDAIVLRGGVYRTGDLVFNQGIALQPYRGERPVLKGTEVATGWEKAGEGVWRTRWTKLFPAHPLSWWNRAKEEAHTPLHRFNNDMVFFDGAFLQSAGGIGELDAKSYYIDYANQQVYIGADPAGHVVEITAHDGALIRTGAEVNGRVSDRKGPQVRGLTLTQYARRAIEIEGKKRFGPDDEPTDEPLGPADPASFGKEAIGTLLENVTISFCSRVAGYFRGDGLIIRNSLISDTGTEGIYVIGSADVLIERTIVRRSNIEHLTGYFASAVKIFNQSRRVTLRDNLVLDHPDANGVWFDVGNRGGVFVNNYVEGATVGFMAEISRDMTVAGNVFVRDGFGVYILNSADAKVYANTFVDAPATFERTERSATGDRFGWHPATGPAVEARDGHVFVDNLVAASDDYRGPLLRFVQSAALCGKLTAPQAIRVDGNVYVRRGADGLVAYAPADAPDCAVAFNGPTDLRAKTGFEAHGTRLDLSLRSLFLAPDLDRYAPRVKLPAGATVPAAVRRLLGWRKGAPASVGAYPFGR